MHHSVVDADPADLLFAMPERFLARGVALAASPPALDLGQLQELAVKAAPAQPLTMPESFLRRLVTLQAFRLGLRRCGLNRFAIKADPARHAVLLRFLFGTVALQVLLFGFRLSPFDDLSVDAIPTCFSAIINCFFSGTKTLPTSPLAFRGWNQNNMSVNTAPAVIRRRITA